MKIIISGLIFFASFSLFSQAWQSVGGGTNNSSHGMLVYNNELINLGSYNNPCQRVSSWDGTNWNCLGGGVGIVARAGTVWNGNLVVVGDFWNNFQPCVGCNGIAMWDGTTWTNLDQGFNNDVLTVTVWNGQLIVGGDFTQANGVPVNRVVRWDVATSTFISMGAPGDFDNDARCMVEFQGDLWVGGDFNNVAGCSPCDGLVKWNDATLTWEGGNSGVDLVGGVNETVRVLYVNPNDGNLYMGGEFPELHDGDAASPDFDMSGIAMYDGSNWFPLGTGLNEYCRAMHEYNGNLIAGGYFTNAGGVAANKIAKWNTTTQTWSPMGQGFDAIGPDEYVKSATVWNGIFFAGGAYTQAEGGPMNFIAQWYEPNVSSPVANFSASATTICEGECVNFSDLSSNSPDSWTWQFPGANTTTSTSQNPSAICFPSAGTHTIQLNACNTNGCDVFTADITVNAIPNLSVNNETICDGQSATLTANPSVSGGIYTWSPGGETTQSINVTPLNTSSYTVEYSLNGCPSGPSIATVTVSSTPSVTVNNSTICQGDVATINALPSSSGGSYSWSPFGEITQSINPSPNSDTQYSVIYTLNGCPSIEQFANVYVNPTYNLSESITVCEGATLTYPDNTTATVFTSTTHTSNLMTVNSCDSIIVSNIQVNPVQNIVEDFDVCAGSNFTYPDGTVSTDIVTNESHNSTFMNQFGCDSIITTNLLVIASPDNSITANGATLTSNQSTANYQWLDCDNNNSPISGATTQNFTASQNGSYSVQVDLNGCIDTSNCAQVIGLAVQDLIQFGLNIFPNPTSDEFFISNDKLKTYALEIFDYQGKLLIATSINSGTNIYSLRDLANGLYVLKISGENQQFTQTISKL